MDAALTLVGYYQGMVDERRRPPRDDLTSALLEAEIDGDRLTDEEIVAFLFLMVVAGNETTTKLLGNAWYWAWRHPDQRAKPFADPARVADWVEETLRFDTSTQMLLRVARTELEIHGSTIAEGDRVLLLVGSANRDETVFPDPDRYDLDRDTSRLVSFGSGRHFCMGAPLARLEARVALGELVKRVSDYDVDPDGDRAGPLDQRPRPGRPPDHGDASADGPLRAQPRAPAGGGDRRLVGHRQGHGRGPGRARPPGGARGPAGGRVRGDGGGHPGRRRRGGRHPSRPGRRRLGRPVRQGGRRRPRSGRDPGLQCGAEHGRLGARHRPRGVRGRARGQPERHPPAGPRPGPGHDRRRRAATSCSSPPTWSSDPDPSMAAYVTSKWGLEGYVRSLQMELEGTGVRATIVRPGPTLTGMGMDWDPEVTGRGHRAVGGVGIRPALELHAPGRGGPGHRGRGQPSPGHPRHRRRAAAGSADQRRDRGRGEPMTIAVDRREPPRVSGGEGENGHLEELRVDPIALLNRVRAECGDVGRVPPGRPRRGAADRGGANELFFRAPEEILDQAEAYPFMTPVFGEGVVFDAPPERRREMLHNQALRDKFMRGHAATIADEVERMVAGWGDEGEIDLLDWFAELTIYTSSACLIGKRFRDELDKRFAELYHDLEQGTDAIAYVDPYAPIESFRRRDAARGGLVRLVEGIMERRAGGPPAGRRRARPARRAHVRSPTRTDRRAFRPTWSPACSSR